ncbi:hypothetical protein GQ42DRAFT_168632 [Ramicandelaber brevisporus]|nr:hypothetical protein GQ42DRAFT_168632 [Ramicandelaber brevisporus]
MQEIKQFFKEEAGNLSQFKSVSQLRGSLSSGNIQTVGIKSKASLASDTRVAQADRLPAVALDKSLGSRTVTNHPEQLLTIPHLEDFIDTSTADSLPGLDDIDVLLLDRRRIIVAVFEKIKKCERLPSCRACWEPFGKWCINQLQTAIREHYPVFKITDLPGGDWFQCSKCRPATAPKVPTSTAAANGGMARLFAADPGILQLITGCSSFTPLFFVHRMFIELVDMIMDQMRFEIEDVTNVVQEAREDDAEQAEQVDSTAAAPDNTQTVINKSQKELARKLKRDLAAFLFGGGVTYSLPRFDWYVKKGTPIKSIATEYINKSELGFIVIFRKAVLNYLESVCMDSDVVSECLFDGDKRDVIIRGVLGGAGKEYDDLYKHAHQMLPEIEDEAVKSKLLIRWLNEYLRYLSLLDNWQQCEILSVSEHRKQQHKPGNAFVTDLVFRNRESIAACSQLAGRINDVNYWQNKHAASLVNNAIYKCFQPGVRVVVFIGDSFNGARGAKNATSIISESMNVVKVCEHNTSRLCFLCRRATVPPVSSVKMLGDGDNKLRARYSDLKTTDSHQSHSRNRDKLCMHCNRVHDRDNGAAVNLAQVERNRGYKINDNKQYWPHEFRRGNYYKADELKVAQHKRNVSKREARVLKDIVSNDELLAKTDMAIKAQEKKLDVVKTWRESAVAEVESFIGEIPSGGWLDEQQMKKFGSIKHTPAKIDGMARKANSLQKSLMLKAEAIKKIKNDHKKNKSNNSN